LRARSLRGACNERLSSPRRVNGTTIMDFRARAAWLASVLASVPRRARKASQPPVPDEVVREIEPALEVMEVRDTGVAAKAPAADRAAVATEDEALAWFEEVLKDFGRNDPD
jgi:hypothetical protein